MNQLKPQKPRPRYQTTRHSNATNAHSSIGRLSFWLVLAGLTILTGMAIFYPKWLFVRSISVEGGGVSLNQTVTEASWQYLQHHKRLWLLPEANILLVSKAKLKTELETSLPVLKRISSLKKQIFPLQLRIQIEPRLPAYVLISNGAEQLIASDGIILPGNNFSDKLLRVEQNTKPLEMGHKAFSEPVIAILASIANNFSQLSGLPKPRLIQLGRNSSQPQNPAPSQSNTDQPAPATSPSKELQLIIASEPAANRPEFTVILEHDSDSQKIFASLKALLAAQSPDRLQSLFYIDLRLPDKAFICLRNTPCAK